MHSKKDYFLLQLVMLVSIMALACAAAIGYISAKAKYECHQVGGTSSIYKGHVERVKLCRDR